MPKGIRSFFLLSAPLSLFAFYVPVLVHSSFGYINDDLVFDYDVLNCCVGYPETQQLLAIGRPLQAFLLNLQLMLADDVGSLGLLRLISVVGIALIAVLFFRHVYTWFDVTPAGAALLSVLLFTLPSLAIGSFWITQSIPSVVPIGLAVLAHGLLRKVLRREIGQVFGLISVVGIIVTGLLIYPPATFFFLALSLTGILFGYRDARSRWWAGLGAEIAIFALSCVLYLLFVKYVWIPGLTATAFGGFDFRSYFQEIAQNHAAYQVGLSFDLAEKLPRLRDLYIFTFSAWFPASPAIGLGGALLVAALLIVSAKHTAPGLSLSPPWNAVIILAIVVWFIPILSGSILASAAYPILYRVTFASMTVVPVVLVLFLDKVVLRGDNSAVPLRRAALAAVLTIAFAGVAVSYYRIDLVVQRLSAEFEHVATSVRDQVPGPDILVPPFQSAPDPWAIQRLDFGYVAFNHYTSSMANAVLRDMGEDPEKYLISYDPLGPRYGASLADGIVFGKQGYPRFVKDVSGISGREPFGRWTDGSDVILEFRQPLPARFRLSLEAAAAASVLGKDITVQVGTASETIRFDKPVPSTVTIPIDTDGTATTLALRLPDVRSPKEQGLSEDPRRLGLALIRLAIETP